METRRIQAGWVGGWEREPLDRQLEKCGTHTVPCARSRRGRSRLVGAACEISFRPTNPPVIDSLGGSTFPPPPPTERLEEETEPERRAGVAQKHDPVP